MKVIVDPDKCCGYGECVAVAPEVFQIGDDNRAHPVHSNDLEGTNADLAREASYSCPVEAIAVSD